MVRFLLVLRLLLLVLPRLLGIGSGPSVELWFWGYGEVTSSFPTVHPPSCSVGKLLGCYNDSAWNDKPVAGRRVLQHTVSLPAGVPLSQESCAAACCAGGFGANPSRPTDAPVAGVEFGADCFCDRPFSPQAAHAHLTNASECEAKPCANGESCGGACRVLVYQ